MPMRRVHEPSSTSSSGGVTYFLQGNNGLVRYIALNCYIIFIRLLRGFFSAL